MCFPPSHEVTKFTHSFSTFEKSKVIFLASEMLFLVIDIFIFCELLDTFINGLKNSGSKLIRTLENVYLKVRQFLSSLNLSHSLGYEIET